MNTLVLVVGILLGVMAVVVIIGVILMLVKKFSKREGGQTAALEGVLNRIESNSSGNVDKVITSMNAANSAVIAGQSHAQESLIASVDKLVAEQKLGFASLEAKLQEQLTAIRQEINATLATMRQEETNQNNQLRTMLDSKMRELTGSVGENLDKLRENNDKKLTEMRDTVEEKLQSTLTERINSSFNVVNTQLEKVYKGLGEMQSLTNNVQNLNKVLNGVKQRGNWGEVALEGMLNQIFTSSQFAKQYPITKGNIVDFAIKLPGADETGEILLPIDSKFPISAYEILVEASENADKEKVAAARKALYAAVKKEAQDISSKYISVPRTTNFAIMYLPIEGLYAEVVRDGALIDLLQNEYRVLPSGPTTLSALLNALQVGFHTLTIQKQSGKIWKILSGFKKDIGTFVSLLTKTKNNADTISKTMDTSAERLNIIQKKLDKLDLPEMTKLGGEGESVDNDGAIEANNEE